MDGPRARRYSRDGIDISNLGALNNHSIELGAAFKF
jgi:hypothetical protein